MAIDCFSKLLLEMRGTTLQYSTRLKKEQTNEEQKLIGEVEQLESQENDNLPALTEKKKNWNFSAIKNSMEY